MVASEKESISLSFRVSSDQTWWSLSISKKFNRLLTPYNSYTTCDQNRMLQSSQWFFQPKFDSQREFKAFDLWMTLAEPCTTFDSGRE